MSTSIVDQLNEHLDLFARLEFMVPRIEQVASVISDSLAAGGKLLLVGNGGSAADAQHIAAELVGRYMRSRSGLAAIALTTDTSALTAIANDFGYEEVFSRQVEALARAGDVLLAYSTSGNSPNILKAVAAARSSGCITVALTGNGGGKLAAQVDHVFTVPSSSTPRIQEAHAFIGHALCDLVDHRFATRI